MQLRRYSTLFFFKTPLPKYFQTWWLGYFLVRSRMEFWICFFRGKKWVCVPCFLASALMTVFITKRGTSSKEITPFFFLAPILQINFLTDRLSFWGNKGEAALRLGIPKRFRYELYPSPAKFWQDGCASVQVQNKTSFLEFCNTGNLRVSELRWQLSNENLVLCEVSLHKLFSPAEEQACYSSG